MLCFVLENALKLLHPFAPFITEEIWRNIPGCEGSIMVSDFPRYNAKLAYKKEAKAFEAVMDVIRAVRNMKTSVNCPPSKKVRVFIAAQNKRMLSANAGAVAKLAGRERRRVYRRFRRSRKISFAGHGKLHRLCAFGRAGRY